MKYRKKPVIIDAVQLKWETWDEICKFAGVGKLSDGKPTGCYVGKDGLALPEGQTSEEIGLLIPTLEGTHLARQNDFIIRGVAGELYPCKPDIFAQTYELVEKEELGGKEMTIQEKAEKYDKLFEDFVAVGECNNCIDGYHPSIS